VMKAFRSVHAGLVGISSSHTSLEASVKFERMLLGYRCISRGPYLTLTTNEKQPTLAREARWSATLRLLNSTEAMIFKITHYFACLGRMCLTIESPQTLHPLESFLLG
jgi:hypothetical protein